jgi:hypothetical protein
MSAELRALAKSRAGRVRLELEPDVRSEAERSKAHDEAIADEVRQQKKSARRGFCGTSWIVRREIFTNEFHFADALSLDGIDWDETHEYDMPLRVRDTDQPPIRPSLDERRFLGIRIWRQKWVRLYRPVVGAVPNGAGAGWLVMVEVVLRF